MVRFCCNRVGLLAAIRSSVLELHIITWNLLTVDLLVWSALPSSRLRMFCKLLGSIHMAGCCEEQVGLVKQRRYLS
jgi:hypothetical protein